MSARFLLCSLGILLWAGAVAAADDSRASRPNVLMIAIDDLNDWVGPLRGHPQVQTPAMDRLAARGVTFANAHCQSPLCNPSRTSLMTGRRPSSTGVYGLAPWFRKVPELSDLETLPQYFAKHGYHTEIGGKIYHGPYGRQEQGEADVWGPAAGVGVKPPKKLIPPTPMGNHPLMDWGTFPHRDEDKGDYKVASWACDQLQVQDSSEPWFMSVGFFLPHVPCYATQKWFDLYPLESLELPSILANDRSDTPDSSWFIHWTLPEPRTSWLRKHDQLKPLVRAYLASVSFVDSQVGRVLDALEESGQAENTIVVLWSDHGYHLGEKGISGKNSLWDRSTRVPLIFAGPSIPQDRRTGQPAELLDIYPTLADLAGLTPPSDVEGISLKPQLLDPENAIRQRPAITTHNQNNHAVRSVRYRYIRYADGAEELYDMQTDPNEYENLAGDPQYADVIAAHKEWLPLINLPPAPGSAHRILVKDGEQFIWEGKPIDPDNRWE
ncbi:Choline-sulfatase [Roseimaritima multifibrata]|uniref:Choline-sulfatase n=1 Tax=Roseimaritima multifibrata TaxID=1930274 RepID=A0A517MCA8_9BACT|nr:sulfatase [Roseimaritima multifibrata]QDS92407.1 Choline-sulfatase [Roseimaritima multifibrata]